MLIVPPTPNFTVSINAWFGEGKAFVFLYLFSSKYVHITSNGTAKLNMVYFQNPKERPECFKITKSWDFSELKWNLMKLCNSCKTCQRNSQWAYQNLETCSLPTTLETTWQELVVTQTSTTLTWTCKGCPTGLNSSCAFSPWKELYKLYVLCQL